MAVWSVDAITEFIRLFREHTCLWKIKSKEYSNRNMRNKAYDELVDFCKSVGFVSADRDLVSKKIQNLRGAFRKELKKVTETRNKSGSSQEDVYKSTLWYFDLLLFTKDQELPTPSISNMLTDESTSETIDDFANHTPSSQHYTNDDIPTSQQPTNLTALPNSDNIIIVELRGFALLAAQSAPGGPRSTMLIQILVFMYIGICLLFYAAYVIDYYFFME